MIHSFLLIGQSNMAGRGYPQEVEPIDNTDLLVLRNGRWWPLYVPVNPDRVTAGINLAESFAHAYARDHGVRVGLIPCADGGTRLEQWQPGGVLFDHALAMARLADRTSHIVGVLWHQGEGDCTPDRYPLYADRLERIIRAFRQEPCLAELPFLVGGLGDYLANYKSPNISALYPRVNDALRQVAGKLERMAYVDAAGLGSNPDNLHFSAPALRTFGLRYYERFLTLEDRGKSYPEKPEWPVPEEMEWL